MPGNTRWNDSLFQEIWCQRRDSNSQTPASKTGCYSNSHTLALWCTGKDLNLRVPLGETGVTAGPFRPGSRNCASDPSPQSTRLRISPFDFAQGRLCGLPASLSLRSTFSFTPHGDTPSGPGNLPKAGREKSMAISMTRVMGSVSDKV